MRRRRRILAFTLPPVVAMAGTVALILATHGALNPLPSSLSPPRAGAVRAKILDRDGRPLSVTYGNRWNLHDEIALHQIPPLLHQAFIEAEDRRFYDHGGVDWMARFGALAQNARAGRGVRGASTISEQVVRMLHPRPRTAWSKWVEGFEAGRLEARFSKGEILEFYLNQVPYARRRRGVVQAARDYFDRDLDTLHPGEMLALAVLVRSPSRWDLRRSVEGVKAPVNRLAQRMQERGFLSSAELESVGSTPLELHDSQLAVAAPHFVQFVRDRAGADAGASIRTHVDSRLQRHVERVLAHQIQVLADRAVTDGAVLVVDHRRDRILAWVNAGGFSENAAESQIDAILTPRQPGSTLKPFVYASALESGWTAATLISDSPLAQQVGQGLHRYRNYSRHHYGPIRLREALGNSLNIPAIRAVQSIGTDVFYGKLHELGFGSLRQHPEVYGDGLALGNGEVTLFELVGAYAALARGGVRRPLAAFVEDGAALRGPTRVYDEAVSSLIADILSDPDARSREFGTGGTLHFPEPTAVKTGTSNDYRDAWALGFSDRFTVGVWMGNLDRNEMDGVSGSIGPAMVLRAVFAELRHDMPSGPIFLSRKLRNARICAISGRAATGDCPVTGEWFRPQNVPTEPCRHVHVARSTADDGDVSPARASAGEVYLSQPTPGLHLATDPRIPDELEAFPMELASDRPPRQVDWFVDDSQIGVTRGDDHRMPWPLSRGEHVARARVWFDDAAEPVETSQVRFLVK